MVNLYQLVYTNLSKYGIKSITIKINDLMIKIIKVNSIS